MSGHITALQGGASSGAAAPTKHEPYGLNDLMNLSVSTGAISPAMARTMRETMHFERQRPIGANHVARLAEEMRRGWFLAGTPIFICVLPDGQQVIVNGNHTLEAITESGVTLPLVIIRRQVRDMDEAAAAYATFDIHRARTWKNTLQAIGFGDEVPMAEKVIAALGLIQTGFTYAGNNEFDRNSRKARFELVPDYTTAAHVIAGCLENAPRIERQYIERAGTMAVALYTARYQPSLAEEFWGEMVRDDGLRATDPRKSFLRWCATNKSGAGSTRPLQARAAATAWNAYFQKRDLDFIRPIHTMRLLGTPLHKGAD